MSFRITAAAWAVKGLSPAAKLVLIRLADMANDEGVCWPSYASIARDVEIDVRSVRRIVAALEAAGIVTRQARHDGRGLQTSNWLTVCPPDDRRPAASVTVAETRTGESGSTRTGESSLGGTGRSSLARTGESSKSSLNHQMNLAPAAGLLLSEEEMAQYRAEARPGETRAQWRARKSARVE